MSLTPLAQALKDFILALKASAEALVLRLLLLHFSLNDFIKRPLILH